MIEQLPHLGYRPEFPVSPIMMWILDTLNAEVQSPFHLGLLTAATEQGAVDRAIFIPWEFRGFLLSGIHWFMRDRLGRAVPRFVSSAQ